MMPSLFRYFTIVGGCLLATLMAINAVTETGGPGPRLLNTAAAVVVSHDPQASRVERMRADEAALRDAEAESLPMTELAHITAPSTTQGDAPQVAEPIGSLTAPMKDEAARAEQLEKVRVKSEGARKKRLAQKRAKAQQEAASRRQDQMYYGNAALYAAQRGEHRGMVTAGPREKTR
jgi:hypothetical protein